MLKLLQLQGTEIYGRIRGEHIEPCLYSQTFTERVNVNIGIRADTNYENLCGKQGAQCRAR